MVREGGGVVEDECEEVAAGRKEVVLDLLRWRAEITDYWLSIQKG